MPPSRSAALLAFALVIAAPATAPAQGMPGISGPYLAAESAARRGDIAEAARLYAEALARDTENADLMERAMVQQIAAGQIERATPVARRLSGASPNHHLGMLVLAVDALKQGDPANARKALASDQPDDAPFVGRLIDAWATVDAGDVAAARGTLAEMEETKVGGGAGEIVAAYHLGLIEAASGNDEAAVAPLQRAVERSGNGTIRLARVRAGVLARLGRMDEARQVIGDRLALTLGDKRLEILARELEAGKIPPPLVQTGVQGAAEALFGVSGFLARGNNTLIALAYAQLAAYLDPDLIEARLLIAELLEQSEQHDLAIAAYESIPADAPEALDAMIGRSEALRAAGRADAAIAVLREAALAYPQAVEAHTSLGDILRRESKFAEAAAAYDGAIALIGTPEPRHWPLYYQRGIAHERSKQWEKAEADFLKALELEADQPLVLNYLGYSWVEMGRNLDRAREMIEKAVEQRPEDGYIVDSLGWVLYRLGDFPGAVEQLERAVELRPVDPVINDHFGDALWMVGRRTEARFQWKRSLSFEPEEKDAERIRRKLAAGLDSVLAEEAAAGNPAVIGSGGAAPNGG